MLKISTKKYINFAYIMAILAWIVMLFFAVTFSVPSLNNICPLQWNIEVHWVTYENIESIPTNRKIAIEALLWLMWIGFVAIWCHIFYFNPTKEWNNWQRKDVKITSFVEWNRYNDKDIPITYCLIATDWINEYKSKNINAKLIKWNKEVLEFLKDLKIDYNPENPEETIKALINIKNWLNWAPSDNNGWLSKLFLKKFGESIDASIDILKINKLPCLELKNHKIIKIWDSVPIFINPENPKKYKFDTDFLLDYKN